MKNLQKVGGIAALYMAAAYVVGIAGFLLVVNIAEVADPVEKVSLLVDNQVFLSIMHLIVFVIWGVFMVFLTLALSERLKAGPPALVKTAAVFGMIWAGLIIASGMIYNVGMGAVVDLFATNPEQAGTVWLAIESVFNGLGGGNEIVGGIWILLVSWAALRLGEFPKALNYLGVVIGLTGILSAIPGLGDLGLIFGLGQIVWFVWLGIVMLRSSNSEAA